jgi:hypothetical protein
MAQANKLVLTNVVFIRPYVQTPVNKKDRKSGRPSETEYCTRIVITNAQAKQFKKDWPNATAVVKKFTKEEIKAAHSIEIDDKFLDGNDEITMLNFNRPAGYPDDSVRPAPTVAALKGSGIVGLQDKIITTGSIGHIQFSARDVRDNKVKLDIAAVGIGKLVEYIKQDNLAFEVEDEEVGSSDNGLAFETEDDAGSVPFEADKPAEQKAPASADDSWDS